MRSIIIISFLTFVSFGIKAQEVLTLQESQTKVSFKHPKENGIYIQPAVYLDFAHVATTFGFGCEFGLHGDASLRALWQYNDRLSFGIGVNFNYMYSFHHQNGYNMMQYLSGQVNGPIYIIGRYYYTKPNVLRPYVDLSVGFLRNYALLNGFRRHFLNSDYNDTWEHNGLSRFYAGISLGMSYNKFDVSLTFDGIPCKYNQWNSQANEYESHKAMYGRVMLGVAYNFRIIKTK